MKEDRPLDAIDRNLLGLLTTNAERSYADLGREVGLSAPAVHERVKRYKASGRIRSVTATLDPAMTGKGFLAFVHVNSSGWGKSHEMIALGDLPEVEEMHSVAGDACILMKVRTQSAEALEALLARIYAIPGVTSTKSYVALSTFVERPVQPGISADLRGGAGPG